VAWASEAKTFDSSRTADDVPLRSTSPPDLLTAPPTRSLLLFALPTLASNVLNSVNASINAIWVGQFLGDVGLAATSNGNLVVFLMFALVFGFGMAASIVIAQSMGRGDIAGVRRAVGAGFGLFLGLGLGVGVLGWCAAPAILRLLGTPPDVFDPALAYLRIMFVGLPPGLLGIFLAMALRGCGDATTPLVLTLPGLALDILLNPLLIAGWGPFPRLGITGAGVATLCANGCTLLLLLSAIYRRDLPVRLRGAELCHLWPARALAGVLIGKGVPMGLQMIVMSVSALALIGLVNRHGTPVIAAYGAANQLWTYIQMPAIAIGVAASAMAAQNIGAGLWDRVDRIMRAGVLINLLMTGALVLLLALVDRWVLALFLGDDVQAILVGTHINLIASSSFVLFGVTLVLSSTMRANGATIAPLLIMTVALIPGRIGAALLLQPRLGLDALWWSFPIGSALSLVLTALYYRHGGWRRGRLLATCEETGEFVQSEAEPAGRIYPNG
jgi:putative MATE family efflux protein